MPRVYIKTAGKDYPEIGVKRGETYHEWAFFRQKPQKSKNYPSRSQLTQREELQMIYNTYDGATASYGPDDVKDMAEQLREAAGIAQEKYDNLPEGFQQGDRGQALEELISNVEQAASDLEYLADRMEEEGEEWDQDETLNEINATEPIVE